jgi:HEAT repeat protein
VLANTSATLPERMACVAEVEKIFLNPAAPDRSQALETLCKLRHPVTGAALAEVRKLAGGPPSSLRGLALWALLLVAEPGAREALAEMLQSPDEAQRLVGAYALRVFREQDAGMLGRLAQAAEHESPRSRAYPYLVSAAFSLNADPARLDSWRSELEKILATESSSDAARFEACQGLLPQVTPAGLPALAGLLGHPGKDTQVGAALVILSVDARR